MEKFPGWFSVVRFPVGLVSVGVLWWVEVWPPPEGRGGKEEGRRVVRGEERLRVRLVGDKRRNIGGFALELHEEGLDSWYELSCHLTEFSLLRFRFLLR